MDAGMVLPPLTVGSSVVTLVHKYHLRQIETISSRIDRVQMKEAPRLHRPELGGGTTVSTRSYQPRYSLAQDLAPPGRPIDSAAR
jgi:hypothetical protein